MNASFRSARAGFTTLELLTVLALLGTAVRMALPALGDRLAAARAGHVAAAIRTVRTAAERYYQEHLRWPADGYVGTTPDGLAAHLPEGFSFEGPGYRLDWEHWALADGLPDDPAARGLLGVTVVTDDRALGRVLVDRLAPEYVHLALDGRYTFLTDRR